MADEWYAIAPLSMWPGMFQANAYKGDVRAQPKSTMMGFNRVIGYGRRAVRLAYHKTFCAAEPGLIVSLTAH